MAWKNFLSLALILIALSIVPIALGKVTNIQFNAASEEHQRLYDVVNTALADYEPKTDVQKHLVLRPQRRNFESAPEDPIYLKLKGEYNDEATLYVAPDNLYIYGFMNKSGSWFMLKGHCFIQPCHELSFSINYGDIIKDGVSELHTVPLGRQSMLHGIHVQSWFNPHIGDPAIHEKQAKLAMSRMTMMISESARFQVIRDSFANAWDGESFATKEDCKILHHWGRLSRLLVNWKFEGTWSGDDADIVKEEINIKGPEAALKKVDVIVRPRAYDSNGMGA